MLVKNWMSKEVITIDVNNSMMDATKKLKEHDIRMLPVMEKGKLVGVITDRDLKGASASDANTLEIHELLFLLSKIKVGDIMAKDPITVPLDYTIGRNSRTPFKKTKYPVFRLSKMGARSRVWSQSRIYSGR